MNINIASPWIFMDIKLWEPLIQKKTPLSVKRNTALFYQNDESGQIYIVQSGRIRLTMFQHDGTEKQLYIAESGALFGERACLLNTTHDATAIAIIDSLVYIIPYTEALAKMNDDFQLSQRFMQLLCRKNSLLIRQVAELSFLDSMQRIAQVLLNLAEAYGEPQKDGKVLIQLRFTHQDVANLINASRVTVSNAFSLLFSQGTILKKGGKALLCDIEALRRMIANERFDL